MWSDPIADLMTRIRNAANIRARQVQVPNSRMKMGICRVLQDEGYINGFDVVDDGNQGILRVDLKYGPRGETVLHSIKRVSKPGCRRYSGSEGLPRVLDGLGICVISTSRGIMSDRSCREQRVGGEVLCTVY